jgi:hypothetical protein
METKLHKTGQSRYEVLLDDATIGHVWNWHGSWGAQVGGKTYHGLKSRKEAIARVERIHQLGR